MLKIKPFIAAIFFSLLFANTGSYAEEEILSLEGARIRGNQELPNVLYLVPWKQPKVYSLERPATTMTATPDFKPLERGSFKRLVSYHESFKRKTMNKLQAQSLEVESK